MAPLQADAKLGLLGDPCLHRGQLPARVSEVEGQPSLRRASVPSASPRLRGPNHELLHLLLSLIIGIRTRDINTLLRFCKETFHCGRPLFQHGCLIEKAISRASLGLRPLSVDTNVLEIYIIISTGVLSTTDPLGVTKKSDVQYFTPYIF